MNHIRHRLAGAGAIVALALLAGLNAARAQDDDRRDYQEESRQVYRLCRNFSLATSNQLASMQPLLSSDELLDLLALRNEESCRRWIDEYWRSHDPLWTTSENEARSEHERRVRVARAQFGRKDWPGWDQRGEVCIRYGMPAARDTVTADVTPNGYVRPGEYWFYPNLGVTAQFEDAYGNGNYTYYLDRVELPSWERFSSDRLRMPAGQWGDMPDRDLDEMPLDLVQGLYGGVFGIPSPANEFENAEFERSLRNFSALLEAQPVIYPFDFKGARVPFVYDVAYFRGGDGIDRVDLNAEFDANGNLTYRATAVVFDRQRTEVARESFPITVPAGAGDAETSVPMIVQLPFMLTAASYDLAVSIEEVETGRFTSYQRVIQPERFDGPLALSTVCFSNGIQPAKEQSSFNRGSLEVVPKPSARYPVKTSVPVYFEIYNLARDDEGSCRYTVSYRVTSKTPPPKGLWKKLTGKDDDGAALTSRFQTTATGPHDVVYLFLKTEELWPGEFEFDVSVVDDVSRSETRRTGQFKLVE